MHTCLSNVIYQSRDSAGGTGKIGTSVAFMQYDDKTVKQYVIIEWLYSKMLARMNFEGF